MKKWHLLCLFWSGPILFSHELLLVCQTPGSHDSKAETSINWSTIFKWKSGEALLNEWNHDGNIFYRDQSFISHGKIGLMICRSILLAVQVISCVSGKCIIIFFFFCSYMSIFFSVKPVRESRFSNCRVLESVEMQPPPFLILFTWTLQHPWFFNMDNLQRQEKLRHHLFIN